ncbi:hypothetical protein D3C73_1472090 [compost metagenome]
MPNATAPNASTVSSISQVLWAVKVMTSSTTASSAKMRFSAGTGPMRSAMRPPHRLPIATDTPYTSSTRLTALAEKPVTSCRIGVR